MPQKYDISVKELFQEDPELLIPFVLPGAKFPIPLDGELIPPTLRTDRTYRIEHEGEIVTLHLEFQAGNDPEMQQRILVYFALLWRDHGHPVLCTVIYLFRCKLPEPVIVIKHNGTEIGRVRFSVLAMWKLDARTFIQQKDYHWYAMLPTMNHANASLLLQAIDEMVKYKQWDSPKLSRNLLKFRVFLERTDMVSPQDKEQVMQRLETFREILEESEWGKARFEQGKLAGIEEGEIIGGLKVLRETILSIIRLQHPTLLELAKQQIEHVTQIKTLTLVRDHILLTTNTDEVRAALMLLSHANQPKQPDTQSITPDN